MKWIILMSTIALLSACACCRSTAVVDYRPVVTTAVVNPVVVPVSYTNYDPVTVIDDNPIDVTTTTVDYY